MIKSLKLNNVYAPLCLASRPKKLFSRAAILLSALFYSLAFFSCDNSSSDNMALFAALAQPPAGTSAPAQPAATVNENGKQMVVFSGCLVGAAGAFPARMSAQVSALLDGGQSDGLSMSAAPTLDTEAGGGYEMFATATAEGMPAVEGVFGTTAADKRFFSMSLEVGNTWSIVCGIRAASGGSVMEDSYDFEAKITSPVLSHTFNLTPKKDGSGSVALSVTADSTVTKAVALCFDEAWKQAAPAGAEKELDLSASPALLNIGSLKSGSYEVSLNFFKDDGSGGRVFLYSVLQTINVFDNAATDMWISSAGEGKIQAHADGKTSLVVDGSEIMAAARTIFYVSDAAGAAALGVSAPSDSNSGSAYEPLESLGRAAQIISAAGNSAQKKEYKIFVNGNIPCNASLDSSLDDVALGITITGLGASGSSDALQGDGSSRSVVTLSTKAPVTIKNLSVTGGRGSSGAGVNITASGARLVLASGAKVVGNTAATSGGGVSVCAGAELEIQNGAEISANVCNQGGGLYIFASNDAVSKGGTVVMTGGTIKGNTGGNGAGGVENHGTFKMSGGTIENNKANYVGAVLVESGSVFEISGSASIPYGALNSSGNLETGEGKNDVFLSAITGGGGAVETITVAGNLYASGVVATIHAKDWPRGKQVLAASGGVTALSDDILEKFDFTDTDFHVNRNKSDARQGLLAGDIYVAGSGYRHCLAAGSDAAGVTGTKNAPFASISYAASKILDGGKNTILVDGSLGAQEITSGLFAANCSELTIKGWSDATHPALGDDGLPVNKLDAGGSGSVFKTESGVPIVMENLMITGGNATNGGGIYVAGGATVTLGEGACVAGNKASYGGGVYVAGDLLIDGGVVGDKNATDHAKYEDDSYSNYAGEKGGGVCFAATGKVTLKSGFVAYNYSKKRGGGIATSFDASSDNSQLDLKGGEVSYNCAGPHDDFEVGGGLFLKGCKFYFTGGKVHHNYAVAGGGGICLQKTVGAAIMSGGSVYDNEYRNTTPGTTVDHKWGSDLLLFDEATLDMSGGRIYIYSSSQKDYGVMIRTSSCALNISGNAEISKETPLLPGDIIYNEGLDTYTYNDNPITIAGALTPPDGDATKKNVYIVPTHWKRGLQVLNASASIPAAEQAALVAANIGRFATTDEEFDVKAKGAAGFISAPICVAALNHTGPGARRSPVNEGALGQKDWGAPSELDSARGTRSEPFAKMSQAVAQMTDNTAPYEILINGTIKGSAYACATFEGSNVGDVTIRGVNGDNSIDVLDVDKLSAGNTSKSIALQFSGAAAASKMSATIQNLKITGANNLGGGDSYPHGGGIYAHWANISLGKGVLITGNKAYYGGGVYLDGSNLFVYADARIGQDASVTATDESDCSNYARGDGGGIYCNQSNAYLGYKEDLSVAELDDAWTGGIYRNCSSYNGGGIRIGNGSKIQIAAGNISRNLATKEGGGIYIHSAGGNSAEISGGKIEENQSQATGSVDGGGGICNCGSLEISGGEINGNIANKGGGVYDGNASGSLSLSGGKFQNNKAVESGGAICHIAGTFTMGGTAWIPYGVTTSDGGTTTTATGAGKNDVFINDEKYITIESALSLPTGASGANATITPRTWKRGTVIAQGKDGGALPTGTKDRLALTDASGDEWQLELSSDKKSASIFAPIYVAASAAYDATTNPGGYRVCGSGGDNSNMGTKSAPYATVTKALGDLNNSGKDYTINIDGKVTDNVTLQLSTTTHAKSLTLTGAKTSSVTADTADCLDGGGANMVLWMKGNTPVTITYLKVSGGKAGGSGGGICLNIGATLNLEASSFVTDNLSQGDGAGIYAGGTLNVMGAAKVYGNKKIDSSGNIIGDSNVYLPSGKVMKVLGDLDGAEIHVSTQTEPSIDFTTSPATVNPVIITNEYQRYNSTDPSAFFKGDKYGVSFDSYYGEAVFGVHGGGISIEDIYKDLAFSIDKTWVDVEAAARTLTFQAKVGGSTSIAFGDGDGKINPSFKVSYHGEDVPSGYWTPSVASNSASLTFNTSGSKVLPAGDYIVTINGDYKGKTYSASFTVGFGKKYEPTAKATPAKAGTDGSAGTSATYVYFGDWPQTVKAADVTVNENDKDPTPHGAFDYYRGSDGAWYVKCMEKGFSTSYTYSDGTPVGQSGIEKWFKVEPIKWRVLTMSFDHDGNASTAPKWLLLAENVLAVEKYYDGNSNDRTISGATVRMGNYQHSAVRAYLNGLSYNKDGTTNSTYNGNGFLQAAFSSDAQIKIATTTVVNDGASTTDASGTLVKADGSDPGYPNDYTCANTNDKVFLLSEREVSTTEYGFGSYTSTGSTSKRVKALTDYAKANHGRAYSGSDKDYWWLRTPSYNYSNYARCVNGEGGSYATNHSAHANTNDIGVVPAICVTLE